MNTQATIHPPSEEIHKKGSARQEVLSELIIPAVPGEYYVYSCKFTLEKPIFALMKCKSNKVRTVKDVEKLGQEASLLFLFGDPDKIRVYSVKSAHASGLLGSPINTELFGETWVSPTAISAENFYEIRSQQDIATLVKACRTACATKRASTLLKLGSVIAVMTDKNKYGLFVVNRLTPTSIQADACHILL